ncbi:ferritin-like domain-containing protein [Pelagibius sp.]|uniref:ferritin-like domain-containing protein n=1 Tax=Pelagibius sp. TaxID=1931238 RepID=UPI0026160519|nr:ferritin-like domain-containing protein [Pelagibius sp.]
MNTLTARAVAVLTDADPAGKAERARTMAADWAEGRIGSLGDTRPPARPARPERPQLKRPGDMPKRKINRGTAGRFALLHALAHIELNAIDLACDILARFPEQGLPNAFHDDWLRVAEEEAKHFLLLEERLDELGGAYGDLPAHDGLWQAAEDTAGDLLARLAVVPLVLEARGLDVTPAMIAKLEAVDDHRSAGVLDVIYRDEVGHVAIGKRWFDHLCQRDGVDPRRTWQDLVRRHFKGQLKPPFNEDARQQANLPPDFYTALAEL